MAPHDHPVFTQVYKLLARAEDSGAVGKARTEVSRALHGRLLVVGLGPAEDLHHLPEAVTEVVGIEPSASVSPWCQRIARTLPSCSSRSASPR